MELVFVPVKVTEKEWGLIVAFPTNYNVIGIVFDAANEEPMNNALDVRLHIFEHAVDV